MEITPEKKRASSNYEDRLCYIVVRLQWKSEGTIKNWQKEDEQGLKMGEEYLEQAALMGFK